MDLTESTEGSVIVLSVNGRLDSATSPELGQRLNALSGNPGGRLVLDLADVDFLSSAGLRVLLSAAKLVQGAQGQLAVCAVQPAVQEVLDISGFSALLSIYPEREAALRAINA